MLIKSYSPNQGKRKYIEENTIQMMFQFLVFFDDACVAIKYFKYFLLLMGVR